MKRTFWMTEIHAPTELTTNTNFADVCCHGLPVTTLDEVKSADELWNICGQLESAVVYIFAAEEGVVAEVLGNCQKFS